MQLPSFRLFAVVISFQLMSQFFGCTEPDSSFRIIVAYREYHFEGEGVSGVATAFTESLPGFQPESNSIIVTGLSYPSCDEDSSVFLFNERNASIPEMKFVSIASIFRRKFIEGAVLEDYTSIRLQCGERVVAHATSDMVIHPATSLIKRGDLTPLNGRVATGSLLVLSTPRIKEEGVPVQTPVMVFQDIIVSPGAELYLTPASNPEDIDEDGTFFFAPVYRNGTFFEFLPEDPELYGGAIIWDGRSGEAYGRASLITV